jgi:hypothetical protein
MHNIKKVKYAEAMPPGGYSEDALVIAERNNGNIETRRANDDIDGGGILAFLREGSTIQPYDGPDAFHADGSKVITAYDILEAKAKVSAWADGFVTSIIGHRPEAEKLSYPIKGPAAVRYLDGNATAEDLALLEAEAMVTGEELSVLATEIVGHIDSEQSYNYYRLTGMVAGLRRMTGKALDQLEVGVDSTAMIDAILVSAIADAETLKNNLLGS